jgi:hypothetical protein
LNIEAMCYGDVNGSFSPSGAKNSIIVLSDDIVNIGDGQVFELPVKVDRSMDLAALTLYLKYADDLLEIKDVKSDLPGLLFNVENGWVNLAWSEVEPVNVADRGNIVTLVMQSKAAITPEQELFTWSSTSEFADAEGEAIEPVNLIISRLNTGANDVIDNPQMVYNFSVTPNPFGRTAKIEVTLPEAAHLKVTLLNKLGQTVSIFADRSMEMGINSWAMDHEKLNLPNGTYFVRFEAVGRQSASSKTIQVIYIK